MSINTTVFFFLVGTLYVQCLPQYPIVNEDRAQTPLTIQINGPGNDITNVAQDIQNVKPVRQLSESEKSAIQNAKYDYNYAIDDHIQGGFIEKVEKRENGIVTGCFQYDDLFIYRTVCYEADARGFRILSDKREASRRTTNDLNGTANVRVSQDGRTLQYSV